MDPNILTFPDTEGQFALIQFGKNEHERGIITTPILYDAPRKDVEAAHNVELLISAAYKKWGVNMVFYLGGGRYEHTFGRHNQPVLLIYGKTPLAFPAEEDLMPVLKDVLRTEYGAKRKCTVTTVHDEQTSELHVL